MVTCGPPLYTTEHLIADSTRVKERGRLELTALYNAYQHWLKTGNVAAIQLLDDEYLLDHFSDRLLLQGVTADTDPVCLAIVRASTMTEPVTEPVPLTEPVPVTEPVLNHDEPS